MLTPELADKIVGNLEKGIPKNAAAAVEGVSKQLLNYWVQRGNTALEKDPLSRDRYAQFALRVEGACAKYQASLLTKLEQSITDKKVDHKPIKFLLQTRSPRDFTIQQQVAGASTHEEDGPEAVTPEEARLSLAAKLAEYLKANPLDEQPSPAPAPEGPAGG